MEIEYIAQEYASLFVRSNDKAHAAKEIIERINNLRYKDGSELDYDTREQIVGLVGEFIAKKRIWKYKYGGYIVAPSVYDNTAFLNLLDYILSQIKK
jgi:hypothetical protein